MGKTLTSRLSIEALLQCLEAGSVDCLTAEWASVVGLEPLCDAGRMEIMGGVARKGGHLIILGECTHADSALFVLLEVCRVILPLHNSVNYSIALSLCLALLVVVLSNGFIDARSTADSDAAADCHENCWPDCHEEKHQPVHKVEQIVAFKAISGVDVGPQDLCPKEEDSITKDSENSLSDGYHDGRSLHIFLKISRSACSLSVGEASDES